MKLVVSDEDKDTEDDVENIAVPAHTDYFEVENIDLSSLKDGKITAKLYDGEDEVATFEIVKNTVAPDSASARTERVSTKTATLSLEGKGVNPITKVKYLVQDYDAAPITDSSKLTKSVDVENNKLTDATIVDDLDSNNAYKVYYVVENKYGSQSE